MDDDEKAPPIFSAVNNECGATTTTITATTEEKYAQAANKMLKEFQFVEARMKSEKRTLLSSWKGTKKRIDWKHEKKRDVYSPVLIRLQRRFNACPSVAMPNNVIISLLCFHYACMQSWFYLAEGVVVVLCC